MGVYLRIQPDIDRSGFQVCFSHLECRLNLAQATINFPHWNQGDVVATTVGCAGGESITLKLDTCRPRYYSRGLLVQGTLGLYTEENQSLYLESEHEASMDDWSGHWGNIKDWYKAYDPERAAGFHRGMDYLVYSDFFNCLRKKAHADRRLRYGELEDSLSGT